MKNNPLHPKNNDAKCQVLTGWATALECANQAPRCGAKTRKGTPCQSPAMPNGRCRMHGGISSGAPKGNRNAWKHGLYDARMMEGKQLFRELLAESRELI
jgi:uncharacterized protein YjcR